MKKLPILVSVAMTMIFSSHVMANDPEIYMQGFTPFVGSLTDGSKSVNMAAGFPLLVTDTEGDATLLQGLIGALLGNSGETAVKTIEEDKDAPSMLYNQPSKSLTISNNFNPQNRIIVINMAGNLLVNNQLPEGNQQIDLTSLSSGNYVAAIIRNNSILKSYKFIIK